MNNPIKFKFSEVLKKRFYKLINIKKKNLIIFKKLFFFSFYDAYNSKNNEVLFYSNCSNNQGKGLICNNGNCVGEGNN